MRVVRLLVLPVCAALLLGCSDDVANDGASPTSVKGRKTETAVSAQQLADDLGCEELTSALLDPEEPVLPSQSLGCRIGEANFGIRLYESTDDRDLVLDYLHQFAGYRNIGPNWIVAVDTPESAQRATEALGGDFVTLQGGVVE